MKRRSISLLFVIVALALAAVIVGNLVRDPGGGAAKGFYPLRELNSDIEALRFYQPLTNAGQHLSAQR